MAGDKPSLCPSCGNFLLPWTMVYLEWRFMLSRPCPRSECVYILVEELFSEGDWNEGMY